MASYAITVHKSQSITVDKMVTDLSERDFQTGLSYVAVSRVKILAGVLMKVRDQDRHTSFGLYYTLPTAGEGVSIFY
ncbi:hypothetical protein HZ326_22844 [Fusarium oxysporum f. sp. albedinis]|nr:hypothetical protein HZ326_22844 [Fusarium oxysporum f. sp. albedinis]